MTSAIIGSILSLVGIILLFVGAIWGLVQAFREDVVWGLLYFFVPFASYVFYIKKWQNTKIRKTFLIQLASLPLIVLGGLMASMSQQSAPQKSSNFRPNTNFSKNASEESPSSFTTVDFNVYPSPTQASSPVSEPSSQLLQAPLPAQKDDFTKSMKLGYAYYGQGDYQRALINFNRALQMRPGNTYAVKAVSNAKSAIVQGRVK